jgi:hypothetical protein
MEKLLSVTVFLQACSSSIILKNCPADILLSNTFQWPQKLNRNSHPYNEETRLTQREICLAFATFG